MRNSRIIDLWLEGRNKTAIAQELGISPSTVSRVLSSPLAQAEIARRAKRRTEKLDDEYAVRIDNARKILLGAVEEAAQKQTELLKNQDPRVQQRAADAILDRVLGNEPKPQSASLDEEHIKLLITAFRESHG